jgi:pimeloyl-ACP methyl ester carboxylesterase
VAAGGSSICFIHGLGESGLCFEHLLHHPGLADRRLLLPDLPGYGRSVWPEEPLGLDELVVYLAGWLRDPTSSSGPPPFVLVGHSMGGVLGTLLCEQNPDLVSLFVNVDGNLSPADCVFSGQATAQPLDRFLEGGFDTLRDQVHDAGIEDRAQRGYHVSMRLCDPRSYHRNSQELVTLSAPEDLAFRLANLPLRTHYVAGVPGGACERSRQLLDAAGATWTGIEPSGHWPFLDQPDAFVALLHELLP